MKSPSLAFATSIVLLSSALLSGCASSGPRLGRCDTSHAVGACAVTVQMQGSRLVVCPVETPTSTPVCMNAAVDVAHPGHKSQQMHYLLEPGHCQALSTTYSSASAASCEAFAVRSKDVVTAER